MREREAMEEIGERIAEGAAYIDAAMHRVLTDIRSFDAGGGWGFQGAMSCAHWLSWRVGWTLGIARDRVRVAQRLGELPLIDAALMKAEISYSKVRAMTRVATPENEALLLDYARHSTAAQLELICRKYQMVQRINALDVGEEAHYRQITRREREDGLIQVQAVLRPDEAALLWKAIEQATADVSAETRSKCDGLMALVQAYTRGGSTDRAPVEVVMTVPQATLAATGDDPGALSDGSCVSAETSRRLSCDCGIVEMIESEAGEALSVGRKTRTIPAAIKRALLTRDEHVCRFPGCSNRAYLDGHHIEHWARGGETSLENLVSLCSYHHGFVHEHGYRVELDEHQRPTFFDPKGRKVNPVPDRARPKRAWADVELAPPYLPCGWDGRSPDYSLAIDGLVSCG
jgi:hypothetical protein